MTSCSSPFRFGLSALLVLLLASCGDRGSRQSQCGPQICAGCCDPRGVCQLGTTAASCGASGSACAVCGAGQDCFAGSCRSGAGGGGTGGNGLDVDAGTGGGGVGAGTGGGGVGAGSGGQAGGGPSDDGGAADAPGDDAGADGGASCPAGRIPCGAECVDTTADPRHCNGCARACGANQVCASSRCETPPDCRQIACTGFTYCDLGTGECRPGCALDTQCTASERCDIATHTCLCRTGFHRCSGSCLADTSLASCGTRCTPCPSSPNGAAACNGTSCSLSCNSGYRLCGETCAACPTDNATAFTCSGSQCVATACAAGHHLCAGRCVGNTSPATCGPSSCTPCPGTPNGAATCDGTSCGLSCAAGFNLCAGACAACPTANASSYRCAGTQCEAESCASGYHVCSGQCVSNTSLDTCGSACTPCATPTNGRATCVATGCSVACDSGYVPCSTGCCQHCSVAGCTGLTWCDTTTGLCSPGCDRNAQCAANQFCCAASHTCVRTSYEGLTVPSSDYRELLYCLNSMRYWYIHRCLPSATVYESICPAGTTERASHYCSLTTRICVPDP